MGDLHYWPPLSPAENGGAVANFRPAPSAAAEPNPEPSAIEAQNWRAAEEATREVLDCIQPTAVSESRRRDVVEYVQRLLKGYLGAEVFPFGSVPLKTYLPDGDIDLTAITFPNMEDSLANEVHSVLEVEEKNTEAEFEVTDVQFIHAEVKLVKCIVQNIVVDISFNQIGGLSTLCFLEKVDRKIGKDHIFKRSIVLIKAWCYYESRILGAHHGLISTYALETLVLHVFHLFHKSLNGPLAVLYRFLDYYSKFDWDSYSVSLHGPVSLPSLPEVVAEPPDIDRAGLLFSNDFIKECLDLFSFSLRGFENSPRVFAQKHLNIVDPLKQYNNLGRSVSKGNFYRIRSAFSYGARKLGRALKQHVDKVAGEVSLFFTNTLDRHGSGERPDVQGATPSSINGRYDELNGFSTSSSHLEPEISNGENFISVASSRGSNGSLADMMNKVNISVSDKENYVGKQYKIKSLNEHRDFRSQQECSKLDSHSTMADVLVKSLSGDARDLSTDRDSDLRTLDVNCKFSRRGKAYHAPHLFIQVENGGDDEIDYDHPETSAARNVFPTSASDRDEAISNETDSTDGLSFCTKTISSPSSCPGSSVASLTSNMFEDSRFSDSSTKENGHGRSSKSSNLSDLTGNEQLHFTNFMHAMQFQGKMMNSYFVPTQPISPSGYRNKHSWNSFPRKNFFIPVGANRVLSGPPGSPTGSYLINSSPTSGPYALKDMQRTRGTGTYFPNTNSRSYRERQSPVKGKGQIFANHPRSPDNCHGNASPDTSMSDRGKPETSSIQKSPIFNGDTCGRPAHLNIPPSPRPGPIFNGDTCGRHAHLDIPLSPLHGSSVVSDGNGSAHSVARKLTFGSIGVESSLSEQASNLDFDSSLNQLSKPVTPPRAQRQFVHSKLKRDTEPYQLKDEDDFPPLKG